MDMAVLIPTCGRPDKLKACLAGIARQTQPPSAILIAIDGGTTAEAEAIANAHAKTFGTRLQVIPLERRGYQPARRVLLKATNTDIFLSLNDDVDPDDRLIEQHAKAHAQAGGAAVVAGAASWMPIERPTLFDQLVQQTALVFFPQRFDEPELAWRQTYGLNFSAPVKLARETGGFYDLPFVYGYDDLEMTWRLQQAGARIIYAPQAKVVHDHRFSPTNVERREYLLGRAAWAYRQVAPAFCTALFQRDIADSAYLTFARDYVRHMRRDAERIERTFQGWATMPAREACAPADLEPLTEHWTLLKRYLWCWGLLDAQEETPDRFALLAEAGPLP